MDISFSFATILQMFICRRNASQDALMIPNSFTCLGEYTNDEGKSILVRLQSDNKTSVS